MLLYSLRVPIPETGVLSVALPLVGPQLQSDVSMQRAVKLVDTDNMKLEFEDMFSTFAKTFKELDIGDVKPSVKQESPALSTVVPPAAQKDHMSVRDDDLLARTAFKTAVDVESKPVSPVAMRAADLFATSISSSSNIASITGPHHAFSKVNLKYTRTRQKIRDNICFHYILCQNSEPISSPPSELRVTLAVNDLFISRVVPKDKDDANIRIQIWLLTDQQNALVWEPATVGKRLSFNGGDRFLGVDPVSGKPYWYTSSSYEKYLRGIQKLDEDGPEVGLKD